MLRSSFDQDLKTRAYVLRRTNYAEADRILNLITPEGKISVMAKSVRRPKSKLAGAVEMFTLSEVNLHFGKSEMAVLTGAKMLKFHSGILKDLVRMEKASEFLKEINRAAEMVDNTEFFEILDKCLMALSDGININLVSAWFLFNTARAMGEQINLQTDIGGEELKPDLIYRWNELEMALEKEPSGLVDANTIKLMRLMWAGDVMMVNRVKNIDEYLPEIMKIAYAIKKVIK